MCLVACLDFVFMWQQKIRNVCSWDFLLGKIELKKLVSLFFFKFNMAICEV